MSADPLYTINCDRCGDWWPSGLGRTAREARQNLRGYGWRLSVKSTAGRVREDHCPKCTGKADSTERGDGQ